ncbi:MAG: (2Fe-2S)-binding protein [Planctomycetaceae bacterium]|nr:(2Fe-2S)-binding protein [Planctomycetaceae bacterium]
MSQIALSSDPIVCRCLNVTESTVRDAIVLYGAETVCDVKRSSGAGSGCMACRRRIQCLLQTQQRQDDTSAIC